MQETRVAKVWVDDDGVHHVAMKPVARITLDDAIALHQARLALMGEQTHQSLMMIHVKRLSMPTREARRFSEGAESQQLTRGAAVVLRSRVARALGNVMMKLLPGTYPTRLFNNEESALSWLRSLPSGDPAGHSSAC